MGGNGRVVRQHGGGGKGREVRQLGGEKGREVRQHGGEKGREVRQLAALSCLRISPIRWQEEVT